jgi:hypothetical protein
LRSRCLRSFKAGGEVLQVSKVKLCRVGDRDLALIAIKLNMKSFIAIIVLVV